MPVFIDITGQRFGRWTVLRHAGRDITGNTLWLCRCDCGGEGVAQGSNLKSGRSQSCGCLRTELQAGNQHGLRHGLARRYLYQTWVDIQHRCYNPTHKAYKNYGARGIAVCERWRGDVAAFYKDIMASIGPRPEGLPRHTLDRVNNNGNYEPGNVRWATYSQQNRNQRRCNLKE